jgi:hypothetical protein
VGYVSSKILGFRALNNLITIVWKCDATLTTHDSGWLVYRLSLTSLNVQTTKTLMRSTKNTLAYIKALSMRKCE